MLKIKVIYRKNLKMSEGKVAAQVSHAIIGLDKIILNKITIDCTIIVLKVSDRKFFELTQINKNCYIQHDWGLTEVKEGEPTAAAWIENN
jgi:peptidyl-tRNA hydrolase